MIWEEINLDWVKQLNIAIRYIEDHLTGTIEYDELAKMLCCSTYQFQRMFAFMNNVPLSEYIRRRKLSLAVADIQKGERVIDIALKYGYSSPTAFSRAFQCLHGITPSEARKKGTLLKTYPPISFKLTITGTEELTYRIEERSAFEVAGVSMLLDKSLEKNFCTVPQFWDNAVQDGTLAKLNSLDKGEVCDLLGISVCGDYETWKYYIAVATSETAKFEFGKLIIPASKWAIFSGKGTNVSLQDLERRVITEWLPFSGFEYGNAPDFENDVQTVWNVITDVKNYIWRTDLSKTEIISDKQFIEYTKNGYATTFTITLFEPYKRWEFDVENSNIKGHWIGIFTQKGEKTEIDFTEDVTAKKVLMKPFVKAYLKKQQAKYVKDLARKLKGNYE